MNKWLIVLIVVLVIIGVGYLFFANNSDSDESPVTGSVVTSGGVSDAAVTVEDGDGVLLEVWRWLSPGQ